ncbi:hypothetical protein PV08_09867 [Exophiala spinifera]|uniref:RTA1 domain protein n=1 Tax=Exophiala spinifera TaxID=91928 RepID=A0A0D2BN87_9EURO|nr:uncharacterized protein PV08_09867 [Exophiala spinifera]KIW12589.1 hypothetical protein PV08_09867 [Exophiala spinifera]
MSSSNNQTASSSDDPHLYFYSPSTPAAVVFSILYLLLTLWHFSLNFIVARHCLVKHKYTIPLFIAALISTAGWVVRILSVRNDTSIPLYAVSSSYIVISPIFVCASLYLLLTRLIRATLPNGPAQSFFRIRPSWLGRVFITSDVFSFLTQCSGSGIASSGNWEGNMKDIGTNVLLVGLALQLATFTVFLVVMARFVRRVNRRQDTGFETGVKKVIVGASIASGFVQIRSIYRVVEFAVGIDGYLFNHEWCLYVLEAMPMFFALAVLAWYHPIRWMQEKRRSDFGMENIR